MLKWKEPKNTMENIERFTILEDRGDRVLVTSNYTESDLAFIPAFVYRKEDLIEA